MSNYWGMDDKTHSLSLRRYFIKGLMEAPLHNGYIHPAEDRGFWEQVPDSVKKKCISAAEMYLDYEWKSRNITDFIEFFQPGDHVPKGEDMMFEKRRAVFYLTAAEAIEHQGRFIGQIVNGIFSICEETTWSVAAHFHVCGEVCQISNANTDPVPSLHDSILDLRAAEVATLLSFALGTLKNQFEAISPRIAERILYELDRRVFEPFLVRDDSWWLGFTTDTDTWTLNNWMTVMNGGIIFAALAVCEDAVRRRRILLRAVTSLDIYFDIFSDDGYCDEGPSYWYAAPMTLFMAVKMLDDACGGNTGVLQDEKLKRMMEYILHMHIAGAHFVGYADSTPVERSGSKHQLILYIGLVLHDRRFVETAKALTGLEGSRENDMIGHLNNIVSLLFAEGRDYKQPEDAPMEIKKKDVWYETGQVLVTRETENQNSGFFLSAKAGHNFESHSHNDVGNYIVYCDGQPVVIDVGAGQYTKHLFGEHRYEIWFTQTQYHNLPVIGSDGQMAGDLYRASDVQCTLEQDAAALSMELKRAYPAECGIQSLRRTVVRREGMVCVEDTYRLAEPQDISEMLITPQRVTIEKNCIVFPQCRMLFDEDCTVVCEPLQTADAKVRERWGEDLHRLIIKREHTKDGVFHFTFAK